MEQLSASQIEKGFVDGDSPLDFIQKNLARRQQAQPAQEPKEQPKEEAAPAPQISDPFSKEDPYEIPTDLDMDKTPENKTDTEAPVEGEEKEPEAEAKEEDAELEEKPPLKKKITKDESIKHLRTKSEALEQEKITLAAELETTRKELEDIKTGLAPNPKIEELETKIKELEHYQAMINFEDSREYKETYQTKITSLVEKARGIASEYNVDAKVFDQASRISNKQERNRFLKQHFGDEVGALEARLALEELEKVYGEAQEAKKKPLEARERLRQEAQAREAREAEERVTRMVSTAKESWTEALKDVSDTNKYPELNYRANDADHNKIVAPIIESAAKDYSNFMKTLASLGVKDMPKDIQKLLARTFTVAKAYDVVNESRNAYAQLAEEVQKTQARSGIYTRPGVGGSMPGIANRGNTQTKTSLNDKIDGLVNSIIVKK